MAEQNKRAQKLAEELRPLVAAKGLYLEQVRMIHAGKHSVLRVTVDLPEGPGGVDSDLLTDLTHDVSEKLDELDPISSAYTLEVSTPGADRPLTEARHFSRVIGRLVRIQTAADTFQGRVVAVRDGMLDVDIDGVGREIALADITKAHVVFEL